MRNLAKETLNLIICGTSGMKISDEEKETLNYPRYDAKYQERLKTFQGNKSYQFMLSKILSRNLKVVFHI